MDAKLIAVATALSAMVVTALPASAKRQVVRPEQSYDQVVGAQRSNGYDHCVYLAKERGYNVGDLFGGGGPARKFVQDCLDGKQR